MKKIYSYIILPVVLLISGGANAEVKHYIGANAAIGEWSLWSPTTLKSAGRASIGIGGGVGFNYELQAGDPTSQTRFLFDVGLSLTGGTTSYSLRDTINKGDLISDQDYFYPSDFYFYHHVTNRRDNYTKIAAQIPILIGVQHKRFYMLAGVKLGYNAMGSTKTTCQITTYGEYPDAYSSIIRQNGQQFYSTPQTREENYTNMALYPFTVDGTLEIGGRIGEITDATGFDVPKRKIEYRLAAFADFTLVGGYRKWNNATKIIDFDPYDPNQNMIQGVKLYDVLSCVQSKQQTQNNIKKDSPVGRNVMIGIKFTVLFQMPEKGTCVLCNDNYHGGWAPSRSTSRRVHYEE